MTSPTRNCRRGERGFTLAALIVILTIMMVFIAYTVPRQWSKVLQRERERQTIFIMKQYARSIHEWATKHGGGWPTTLDQIKEARLPRMIRGPKGEWADPLTGKVDWILVPPTAVQPGGPPPPGPGPTPGAGPGAAPGSGTTPGAGATPVAGPTPGAAPGQTPQNSGAFNAAASPKDYTGPFIGVRPPLTGDAMLELNGQKTYDTWYYTVFDLRNEINLRVNPPPTPR